MMKSGPFIVLLVVVLWSPSQARTWERHEHAVWGAPSQEQGITCTTVRAVVALWGFSQARQFALDHGMTQSQEDRARRCLATDAP